MEVSVPYCLLACNKTKMLYLGPEGSRCAPSSQDCDIIAGSISQCTFPYPPTMNATLSRSSDIASTNTSSLQATNPPKPDAPPEIEIVKGWKYMGCYTDNVQDRTLIAKRSRGRFMTPEICARICKGYRYFGVEYSNE